MESTGGGEYSIINHNSQLILRAIATFGLILAHIKKLRGNIRNSSCPNPSTTLRYGVLNLLIPVFQKYHYLEVNLRHHIPKWLIYQTYTACPIYGTFSAVPRWP